MAAPGRVRPRASPRSAMACACRGRRRWRLRWPRGRRLRRPRLQHGDAEGSRCAHVRLSPIRLDLDLKKSPGFQPRGAAVAASVASGAAASAASVAALLRCIWFRALPDLCVGIVSERLERLRCPSRLPPLLGYWKPRHVRGFLWLTRKVKCARVAAIVPSPLGGRSWDSLSVPNCSPEVFVHTRRHVFVVRVRDVFAYRL